MLNRIGSSVAGVALAVTAAAMAGEPPSEARVTARHIVVQAADASDEELQAISAALGAFRGVFRVAIFPSDQCVSILAPADGLATVERVIQYLDLAGYTVKDADRDVYDRIETVLKSMSFDVPASLAGSCGPAESGAASQPAAALTSLADSVEPLREAFNAATGRYRFVALLSPT